ncbi:acyl-CoA dehydrogenase family protein [Parendozoicomonas sp. Alg238-R29]|uniref:acyl-CoA dehydrogenase family protein n=1 Tax=Parendozoicomonas sp. Alg238-R29 TaxID=2993446 RepID=UPI00248EDF02|nr:acyl-CoA dehydrogenase family protein [Parendozoicomonas sp. Alg238-R29]
MKALADILRNEVLLCESFDDWKAFWQKEERRIPLSSPERGTLEQAFYDGCRADRVAWAFAGGYQWAIRSLLPSYIDNSSILALCITESGGGHPKKIHSELKQSGNNWNLSGKKQFVSGGTGADVLVIAAREGEQLDGRPQLRMLTLEADTAGLTLQDMPALSIVPEVPHASVVMEGIQVSSEQVLPGDGYLNYIRPFRMCEDLHVQAALLGMVVRKAHSQKVVEMVEQALAYFHLLKGCQLQEEPSAAGLAMAGFEPRLMSLLDDVMGIITDEDELRAWKRDKQLLSVAGKARAIRKEKARHWLGF